jgi:prevent-host-death family protein
MAQRVAFGEARRRLAPLMDQVEREHEHVILTRNGRDSTAMMSAVEYESLIATLEVLNDPSAMADLAASDADVRAGRLYDRVGRKTTLRRRG